MKEIYKTPKYSHPISKIKILPPHNSPTTTYYCTLVSRVCLYLSVYSQFRPEEQIIQTLLMDTSGHCWRARRECCSLLLGSGWNLGPHGRENTALGAGTPPPPAQVPSCFEDAGRLFWERGFLDFSGQDLRTWMSDLFSKPSALSIFQRAITTIQVLFFSSINPGPLCLR
jgi:hypothetical protein